MSEQEKLCKVVRQIIQAFALVFCAISAIYAAGFYINLARELM